MYLEMARDDGDTRVIALPDDPHQPHTPPPASTAEWGGSAPFSGLVFTSDQASYAFFIVSIPAPDRNRMDWRLCTDLQGAASALSRRSWTFCVLDVRGAWVHAGGNLAALRFFAPRMPIIVLMDHTSPQRLAEKLLAGGAFETVSSAEPSNSHLLAAIRHAQWAQKAAIDTPSAPTATTADADRPLLAEVSHEMRSPLSSIIGFAETIEQEALGPWETGEDQYRDYARHIRSSGQHLLDLFDDLLEIGDAPTFGLGHQDLLQPAQMLADVAAMLETAAARKGLNLHVGTVTGAAVRGSQRLISQSLLNLVQNAVKFTPAGGSVTLSYEYDGGGVFTVTDTGIGMTAPPALADRAVRAAPSENQGGHGLGLRFVQRVAESHGGRLEVNATLGKGTVMRLVIPPASSPMPAIEHRGTIG